jgi:glycosyltransferase involved in cell wall biosynthesis/GT2 family glycosyltransferase
MVLSVTSEADEGPIAQPGTPLASIIVPLLDAARCLEGTLAAIGAQKLDGGLEILVVDGGSRDGSRAIVERAARADDRIRLLDNPARLTPTALNIGLGTARGVYVARMDAHTQFARDYVALGIERLQRGDVACASGPQLAVGAGPTSRAVAVALQSPLGVGGASFRRAGREEVEIDSSFCGVWRRDLLLQLRGWDEDWPVNQDAELAARIRARGGRIVCMPQMAALYAPRASLRGLARQYWRYGQYRAKTAGRHPDALRRSHVLAPGLVAMAVAGAVPRRITRPARRALGLYGAVVAAEGLRSARRTRAAGLAPRVSAALAVMHAAWGAGFLQGCRRFGVPWRALAGLVRWPPAGAVRQRPAPPAPGSELRIGYVVSRFPALSETFVLRELAEVDARKGVRCELFSLFPDGGGPVHPSARAWVPRRSCATPLGSARSAAYWAARRPLRLAGVIALVAHDYRRHPRLLGRALVTVACALEHARRLRVAPVDHLHAHFATYPALAAWICSRLVGVPYSFTAHAHDLFIHRIGLRRRIEDAAFCVGISEHNARILRALAPGRSADVHVVHCGVHPTSLPVRLRAPQPGAPMRVACVAALRPYKGHHVLVDAIARLACAGEAVELDLVGDGPLRGELERQCARPGVATRVHFLGGLTEPEVAEVLDRADAFAQASVVQPDGDTDGIPVALMEAMAAGVPVVASRVSGVPELVRDGETGLLVPPGDAAALADALRSLRAEPGAAIERARAARALVEEQFAVEGQSSRLLALIRASSSSPRPPAAAPALVERHEKVH